MHGLLTGISKPNAQTANKQIAEWLLSPISDDDTQGRSIKKRTHATRTRRQQHRERRQLSVLAAVVSIAVATNEAIKATFI